MNQEEIDALDFLLCRGWGHVATVMFSPKGHWPRPEEEKLAFLMMKYDYTYGGIK